MLEEKGYIRVRIRERASENDSPRGGRHISQPADVHNLFIRLGLSPVLCTCKLRALATEDAVASNCLQHFWAAATCQWVRLGLHELATKACDRRTNGCSRWRFDKDSNRLL